MINEETYRSFDDYSEDDYRKDVLSNCVRGCKVTYLNPDTKIFNSNNEIVTFNAHIGVFDISKAQQRDSMAQMNFFNNILTDLVKLKLPILLVASKYDKLDIDIRQQLNNLLGQKKAFRTIDILETSAKFNINVSDILLYFMNSFVAKTGAGRYSIKPYSYKMKLQQYSNEQLMLQYETIVKSFVLKNYSRTFKEFEEFVDLKVFLRSLSYVKLQENYRKITEIVTSVIKQRILMMYSVLLKKIIHDELQTANYNFSTADELTHYLLCCSSFLTQFQDTTADDSCYVESIFREAHITQCKSICYPLPRFLIESNSPYNQLKLVQICLDEHKICNESEQLLNLINVYLGNRDNIGVLIDNGFVELDETFSSHKQWCNVREAAYKAYKERIKCLKDNLKQELNITLFRNNYYFNLMDSFPSTTPTSIIINYLLKQCNITQTHIYLTSSKIKDFYQKCLMKFIEITRNDNLKDEKDECYLLWDVDCHYGGDSGSKCQLNTAHYLKWVSNYSVTDTVPVYIIICETSNLSLTTKIVKSIDKALIEFKKKNSTVNISYQVIQSILLDTTCPNSPWQQLMDNLSYNPATMLMGVIVEDSKESIKSWDNFLNKLIEGLAVPDDQFQTFKKNISLISLTSSLVIKPKETSSADKSECQSMPRSNYSISVESFMKKSSILKIFSDIFQSTTSLLSKEPFEIWFVVLCDVTNDVKEKDIIEIILTKLNRFVILAKYKEFLLVLGEYDGCVAVFRVRVVPFHQVYKLLVQSSTQSTNQIQSLIQLMFIYTSHKLYSQITMLNLLHKIQKSVCIDNTINNAIIIAHILQLTIIHNELDFQNDVCGDVCNLDYVESIKSYRINSDESYKNITNTTTTNFYNGVCTSKSMQCDQYSMHQKPIFVGSSVSQKPIDDMCCILNGKYYNGERTCFCEKAINDKSEIFLNEISYHINMSKSHLKTNEEQINNLLSNVYNLSKHECNQSCKVNEGFQVDSQSLCCHLSVAQSTPHDFTTASPVSQFVEIEKLKIGDGERCIEFVDSTPLGSHNKTTILDNTKDEKITDPFVDKSEASSMIWVNCTNKSHQDNLPSSVSPYRNYSGPNSPFSLSQRATPLTPNFLSSYTPTPSFLFPSPSDRRNHPFRFRHHSVSQQRNNTPHGTSNFLDSNSQPHTHRSFRSKLSQFFSSDRSHNKSLSGKQNAPKSKKKNKMAPTSPVLQHSPVKTNSFTISRNSSRNNSSSSNSRQTSSVTQSPISLYTFNYPHPDSNYSNSDTSQITSPDSFTTNTTTTNPSIRDLRSPKMPIINNSAKGIRKKKFPFDHQ